MYSPHEIQTQKDELRQAVLNARPFKPLYLIPVDDTTDTKYTK